MPYEAELDEMIEEDMAKNRKLLSEFSAFSEIYSKYPALII